MTKKGSAAKRHRQSEKRRIRNRIIKSRVKTLTKGFLSTVSNKEKDEAQIKYNELTGLIDIAAQNGVYHKNKAARKKSRLYKVLSKVN